VQGGPDLKDSLNQISGGGGHVRWNVDSIRDRTRAWIEEPILYEDRGRKSKKLKPERGGNKKG